MNTPDIRPVEHASFTMKWGDISIAIDPVGAPAHYAHPSLVLVTDIHSDHLDIATLVALAAPMIAPKAVVAMMPEGLAKLATILNNDESIDAAGFRITAIPMYNRPGADNAGYHPKGRGNGYLIEKSGVRVYIAGDTAGIPEMRALANIDIAFMPMNLPYTMSVEEAAGATLSFRPKVAIPYHYRGPEGLSDVAAYKRLVESANAGTHVELLKWY